VDPCIDCFIRVAFPGMIGMIVHLDFIRIGYVQAIQRAGQAARRIWSMAS